MAYNGLHVTSEKPVCIKVCWVCGQDWPCMEEQRRSRARKTEWIVALGRALNGMLR